MGTAGLLVGLGIVGCNNSSATKASAPTGSPGASAAAAAPRTPKAVSEKAVPVESNPPGDIPDSVAFVPYRNAPGRYSFSHPEGWAEIAAGTSVSFTEKLNGVQVEVVRPFSPPTPTSARRNDVPALMRSQAAFELRSVAAVSLPSGAGVRIVYRRNSAPDPVTGRQYRDEVERYEVAAGGRELAVELFGPVGSDNVDAYRIMIQSLKLS